jgi:hypothetical protein
MYYKQGDDHPYSLEISLSVPDECYDSLNMAFPVPKTSSGNVLQLTATTTDVKELKKNYYDMVYAQKQIPFSGHFCCFDRINNLFLSKVEKEEKVRFIHVIETLSPMFEPTLEIDKDVNNGVNWMRISNTVHNEGETSNHSLASLTVSWLNIFKGLCNNPENLYNEYIDSLIAYTLIAKLADICSIFNLGTISKIGTENKDAVGSSLFLPEFIPFALDLSEEFFNACSEILKYLSFLFFSLPSTTPDFIAVSLSYTLLSLLRILRLNLEYLSHSSLTPMSGGLTLQNKNDIQTSIQRLLGWNRDSVSDDLKVENSPLHSICKLALERSIRNLALETALIISLEFDFFFFLLVINILL